MSASSWFVSRQELLVKRSRMDCLGRREYRAPSGAPIAGVKGRRMRVKSISKYSGTRNESYKRKVV